jgi:hypothetical protein
MENATQFVHGTPKLAASHRTYIGQQSVPVQRGVPNMNVIGVHSMGLFAKLLVTFLAWQVCWMMSD